MEQRFKLILFTVLGVTLLCGALALITALVTPEPAPPMVADLFKTCTTLFHTGVGAIIGLLGGNALD